MIRMSDVSMEYDNGVRAVKKATLRIDEGEFVFLVGPSGSGKSTLIKLLTGEVKPTSGRIVVNNYNIGAIKKREIPYLRRTLGVVFQDFRLIEKKTVYENVAFAMRAVGAKNRAIRKRVPYVLDLVGLSEKADTRPLELSGGEQQRVAIARALVNNPRLIIADEPTGNLDPVRSFELMTLFEKINELGTTILIVTHEKELVDDFEKRVIMIDSGEIISDATGRYYADDEYYDEEYDDIKQDEIELNDNSATKKNDSGNAPLTMLFEKLTKKTDDTQKISSDLDAEQNNLDIKDCEVSGDITHGESHESSDLLIDNKQDIQTTDDELSVITQDEYTDKFNKIEDGTLSGLSDYFESDLENSQEKNEDFQVEKQSADNISDISPISKIINVNINTAAIQKQEQRIKTSVGNVDASLEELIERFEKRVGIEPSQSQSQKIDDNPRQASGEIDNIQSKQVEK